MASQEAWSEIIVCRHAFGLLSKEPTPHLGGPRFDAWLQLLTPADSCQCTTEEVVMMAQVVPAWLPASPSTQSLGCYEHLGSEFWDGNSFGLYLLSKNLNQRACGTQREGNSLFSNEGIKIFRL